MSKTAGSIHVSNDSSSNNINPLLSLLIMLTSDPLLAIAFSVSFDMAMQAKGSRTTHLFTSMPHPESPPHHDSGYLGTRTLEKGVHTFLLLSQVQIDTATCRDADPQQGVVNPVRNPHANASTLLFPSAASLPTTAAPAATT